MMMRKINIKSYTVQLVTDKGPQVVPYDVRRSITNVVLSPEQKLGMAELLRYSRITDKIEATKEDFILLEEAEYQIIKQSFNKFKGFGINEVELCRRIEEAEEVKVKEVKKKK